VSLEAGRALLLGMGETIAAHWLLVALACLVLFVVLRPLTAPLRIQKVGFDARVLRHELLYSALTLGASAAAIGWLWDGLRAGGRLTFAAGGAPPWVVAAEFAVYFFAFDLYFYALHRLMHWGPVYRLVHAHHHRSTAPNPLTAFSFHPLEGVLTGGFLPVFLAAFEVHRESLALIGGFQPLMSIYVHCGHELAPRFWRRARATRWLLTPLFHDLHHQRFHCNYGGFTTLWDRAFGTDGPALEPAVEPARAA
jgi:sterol desaturase/sphingolipid hydroxylase (fatty acid hydroxylase superfamily)